MRLEGILAHSNWRSDAAGETTTKAAPSHLTLQSHIVSDLREAGYDPHGLIELIQNTIRGPWEKIDGIGGTLTRVGDVVFLRQWDRKHREVAALLHALRNHARETYVTTSPVHEVIRVKLQEPVRVEFVDTPLSEAVAVLAQETGVDVHIDEHALTHVGIPTDEPVTFTLTDKPLETVLRYMLQSLEITAVPHLGRLLITTAEVAEETTHVVLHDVSDVCRTKEETELLSRAVVNETAGPWEDVDGIGGVISAPVSGIMVVRQTEAVLEEVRELLAAYRRAAELAGSLSGFAAEQERIETRHYRMNAKTAGDLQRVLRQFDRPGTWLTGSFGPHDITPEMIGEIETVSIDPRIEKLPGRAVSGPAPGEKADNDGKPSAEEEQPDVLVIPQAVLVIKHTGAVHREIDRFLNQVKHANPAHAGNLDISGTEGTRSGPVGRGGGFFQVSDR